MEATLEKIRMPRTTTTPVDSWVPTPSWSPRKTMKAATTTFDRNETTKTLSSKMPSRIARTPPKDGVEGRDDGDGQVGLQADRDGRVQQQAGDDADDQADDGDHRVTSGVGLGFGLVDALVDGDGLAVASVRPARGRSCRAAATGRRRCSSSTGCRSWPAGPPGSCRRRSARTRRGGPAGRRWRWTTYGGVSGPVVDEDRLPGEADRGARGEALPVDADGLGARLPQPVDDDLEVERGDPPLVGGARRDPRLARAGLGGGRVVESDRHPRPVHRDVAGEDGEPDSSVASPPEPSARCCARRPAPAASAPPRPARHRAPAGPAPGR